jgi:hypothetical protein
MSCSACWMLKGSMTGRSRLSMRAPLRRRGGVDCIGTFTFGKMSRRAWGCRPGSGRPFRWSGLLRSQQSTFGFSKGEAKRSEYGARESRSLVWTARTRAPCICSSTRFVPEMLFPSVPIVGWFFTLADTFAIFGRQRRCLHDRIAGTTVIVEMESPWYEGSLRLCREMVSLAQKQSLPPTAEGRDRPLAADPPCAASSGHWQSRKVVDY